MKQQITNLMTAAACSLLAAVSSQALAVRPVQAVAAARGNNGTVKVDAREFDTHPDNEPHVGCTFQIDFYNFDKGDIHADVTFAAQPPTGNGVLLTDKVFIGEDEAGGGTDIDAQKTYDLQAALAGYTPHPQQGYHVKLTVDNDAAPGAGKHKVFWVLCQQPSAQQPSSGGQGNGQTPGGANQTSGGTSPQQISSPSGGHVLGGSTSAPGTTTQPPVTPQTAPQPAVLPETGGFRPAFLAAAGSAALGAVSLIASRVVGMKRRLLR